MIVKMIYLINSDSIKSKNENFLGYFLHGLKLKSYKFNIYKTKKNKKTYFHQMFLEIKKIIS